MTTETTATTTATTHTNGTPEKKTRNRVPLTDAEKSAIAKAAKATLAALSIDGAFAGCIVRDAEGKPDMDLSRKAWSDAAKDFLRSKGEIIAAGRGGATTDMENVAKAAYAAFVKLVQKHGTETVQLSELVYATCAELAPAFAEMDRCKKAVHTTLTGNPRFAVKAGKFKFAGHSVGLVGEPSAPEPFNPWSGAPPSVDEKPAPKANGKKK